MFSICIKIVCPAKCGLFTPLDFKIVVQAIAEQPDLLQVSIGYPGEEVN